MATADITSERLRELLSYDPLTGLFRWRMGRRSVKAGALAGSLKKNGYVHISIDFQTHCAHRLAWLYVYGSFPGPYLDHKNAVKSDNRIANLRDVTCSANLQNIVRARRDNKTGFLGVGKDGNRFRSRIELGGKQISVGSYATPEEASEAYLAAKKIAHPGAFPE
ncbi:HNH endonuclease [Hydrogenophaga aromaticivorans]|uniref:HNH endonuclease signature motif containing protein n=1 Tax=Hydrogenophaga aromaticivorans TaxID=2610898 RepID=UPI001B359023|nr:HNH endonuclease signature motif containing protein [Hydrogenophaga aromaticivorans]MBQ0917460.1 HNH endonuclease [Hydrogenophaga aromaticivorans]